MKLVKVMGSRLEKSEGIKIGREETLAEMIYNMKQHGYSIEKWQI